MTSFMQVSPPRRPETILSEMRFYSEAVIFTISCIEHTLILSCYVLFESGYFADNNIQISKNDEKMFGKLSFERFELKIESMFFVNYSIKTDAVIQVTGVSGVPFFLFGVAISAICLILTTSHVC